MIGVKGHSERGWEGEQPGAHEPCGFLKRLRPRCPQTHTGGPRGLCPLSPPGPVEGPGLRPRPLAARTDAAFKAFLDAQNPRQQHSATLESYLIKPIQRVLKYPLLLRELFVLTDADSEEHYHLDGEPAPPARTPPTPPRPPRPWRAREARDPTHAPPHGPSCPARPAPVAIKTMNKVASHINEMQKIHEEFGAVFDQLIAEQTGEKREVRMPAPVPGAGVTPAVGRTSERPAPAVRAGRGQRARVHTAAGPGWL